MLLLEQNAIISPGQNGSFLFCHYLLLLGCFLIARKRLGRDHWIQILKVSWHFIADGLMEKSLVKLLGWLQNLPNANIDINEWCCWFVPSYRGNVSWIFGTPSSGKQYYRSWMPPKCSPDVFSISTWARVDTFSSDLNALLVCFASDIHWISGVCINWNQHSILTSDPNWVQVRLHIQNPIWLAVNHLLFNGNPLRFWGVHVPAMFQPLVPRTLIKNLDDSLQARFAKSNFSPSTEQQTTQNHPKTSNTPIFLGKIWGVLGGCIPFPPAKSKETSPPNLHPVGNPNQTRGVENESRISTRSGVATPRMESPNHPRVSGGKKKPFKKVWHLQTCVFFGVFWLTLRKMIFQRNKILCFVFLVKKEFFFPILFVAEHVFGPKAIPTSFIYPFGIVRHGKSLELELSM